MAHTMDLAFVLRGNAHALDFSLHVPPRGRPPPTQVYYNLLNSEYLVCDPANGEDPRGADQWLLDVNVADHLTYLGFDFTANYLICKL